MVGVTWTAISILGACAFFALGLAFKSVGGLREEMRAEIGGLREEMRAEIGGLREEMRAEFGEVRREIVRLEGKLREEMRAEFGEVRREIVRLEGKVDANTERIDKMNARVDHLFLEVATLRSELGRIEESRHP